MTSKILIAGGGIGGLSAAIALLDRGFDVTVFEQTPEMGAVGAGLQLSANATRVLFQLGLGEALLKVTRPPGGKYIRLWDTAEEWKLFDLGQESLARYGYPYFMLYRPDLQKVLVDGLRARKPDALVLGAKVADIVQSADGVQVKLTDGRTFSGNGLIGADGVHSIVRMKKIAEDKPRFSGCIAWRGVVPMEKLPSHMHTSAAINWIGPGAHFTQYTIGIGDKIGFTGVVEKAGWETESWTNEGSVEECLGDFSGWHANVQSLIKNMAAPLKWAMMVRDPISNWNNGRVTLLGDAAHPTLPFLAQGAAMAVEDAGVIARALAAHPDDIAHAWRVYQATRIERTTKIVQGSSANTKRFHSADLATTKGATAYVNTEWEESKVRARYEWLFKYEPENVPLAEPTPVAA
jgi:salicylate hydroxylase